MKTDIIRYYLLPIFTARQLHWDVSVAGLVTDL